MGRNFRVIIAFVLALVFLPASGQAQAGIRTFPDFDKLGLAVVSASGSEAAGPVEIVLSARTEVELTAALVEKNTGRTAAGVVDIVSTGAGWIVSLGFRETGDYDLTLYGRPGQPAGGKSAPLLSAGFRVRIAPAAWELTPDCERLGVKVASTVPPTAAGKAWIVLAVKPEVSVAYGLENKATREQLWTAMRIDTRGDLKMIAIDFPEPGVYELTLSGAPGGEKKFVRLGSLKLDASFELSPAESLARALRMQDPVRLKKALDRGADPNARVRGYAEYVDRGVKKDISAPALFHVFRWYKGADAQLEAWKLLKIRGADFRTLTGAGATVLSAFLGAVPREPETAMKVCRALIDLGADPAQETAYSYYLNKELVTTTASLLVDLEKYGFRDARKYAPFIPLFMSRGASTRVRPASDDSFLAPLFRRYAEGAKTFLQAYLDAGYDPVPGDLAAMIFTVHSDKFDGDFDFVARVLAKTSHLNDKNRYGATFLHSIAGYDKPDSAVVQKLISLAASHKADLNATNNYGETPLMAAVERDNQPVFTALLKQGADPAFVGAGGNIFHALVARPSGQVTPGQIDRFIALKADINARDAQGRTALYRACESEKNLALVKLLAIKGADPALPDADGFTAAGWSRTHAYKELTAYLASLGVPDNTGGWPVGNEAPACRVVLTGDLKGLAALPPGEFEARVARTADGVPASPLHLAAEKGDAGVIEALARKKVRWETGDRYGRTPLEIAVLAGNRPAVRALLAAGADPNKTNSRGVSPLVRAVCADSDLAETLLSGPVAPDWTALPAPLAVRASLDRIKGLPRVIWRPSDLPSCAALGRADILEWLGAAVKPEQGTALEMLERATASRKAFDDYLAAAKTPLPVKTVPAAARHKRGSYLLPLPSWSPWMDRDPKLRLEKYPVTVWVPKGYDGSESYGLMISMMNAQSKNQGPSDAYVATLEKRKLIYVGFDPYNGVFNGGSDEFMSTNHERLVLAAAHYMFGAYAVDRKRVYLTGFSWGGRLTGEIVPKQPRVFTGGIAVGGCFTTLVGGRVIPSLMHARRRAAMVCATGDWDYNRQETFNGYDTLHFLGYEAHFIQEPRRGHARISGDNFEKAIAILDEASARRLKDE